MVVAALIFPSIDTDLCDNMPYFKKKLNTLIINLNEQYCYCTDKKNKLNLTSSNEMIISQYYTETSATISTKAAITVTHAHFMQQVANANFPKA